MVSWAGQRTGDKGKLFLCEDSWVVRTGSGRCCHLPSQRISIPNRIKPSSDLMAGPAQGRQSDRRLPCWLQVSFAAVIFICKNDNRSERYILKLFISIKTEAHS